MNDYYDRLARIESANNPNARAKTSSATGLYQMTRGTFADLQKAKPWLQYSTWEQHASDPTVQRNFVEELTARNDAALRKGGHEINDLNRYLAHFAGAGGASKLLAANPNATMAQVLGEQAARANPTLANKTVAELKANFGKKLGAPMPVASSSSSGKPWEMDWSVKMAEGGSPWERNWTEQPYENPLPPPVSEGTKQPRPKEAYWKGLGRAGLQGLSFGWGDEAEAYLRSKLQKDKTYEQHLADTRGKLEEFAQENPIASTGAELVGGLVLPGFGAAKSATTLAKAGLRSAQGLKAARNLGATGAGLGALAGAGTAEEGNRLEGALEGGVTGGVAAPILAIGGAKAIQGGSKLLNAISGKAPVEKAERKVVERLMGDKADVDSIRNAAREAVDLDLDRRVLDIGAKNTEDLAQTIASKQGAGSQELVETLENRIQNAKENVAHKINTQVEGGKHYYATKETLDEARKVKAAPLYDEAYKAPPVQSETINKFLQMQPFKKAYARAGALAEQEAAVLEAGFIQKIAKASTPAEKEALAIQMQSELNKLKLPELTPENLQVGIPVKSLDMVKRGIDDILSNAYRPNASTVDLDDARALKPLKNIFLEEVDKAVPKYAEARKIAKGAIESTEAITNGRDTFLKTKSPQELQANFAKLDDHDKEYFRVGAKEALLQSFMNSSQNRNAAQNIINNPTTKAKLSMLFDDPKDADKFIRGLQEEAKQVIRAQKAVRGSPTQPRFASEADWDEKGTGIGSDILNTLAGGFHAAASPASPQGWARVVSSLSGLKDKVLPSISEAQASEAGRILNLPLTVGGQGQRAVNPELENLLQRLGEREKRMRQMQQAQGVAFRPSVAGTGGATLGVTSRRQPYGYIEDEEEGRAIGGLVGQEPMSHNRSPLSMVVFR